MYGWYLEGVTDDVLDIYKSVSTIFLYFNKIDKKFLFSFSLLEKKKKSLIILSYDSLLFMIYEFCDI